MSEPREILDVSKRTRERPCPLTGADPNRVPLRRLYDDEDHRPEKITHTERKRP